MPIRALLLAIAENGFKKSLKDFWLFQVIFEVDLCRKALSFYRPIANKANA